MEFRQCSTVFVQQRSNNNPHLCITWAIPQMWSCPAVTKLKMEGRYKRLEGIRTAPPTPPPLDSC